jgi:hypothetical protein
MDHTSRLPLLLLTTGERLLLGSDTTCWSRIIWECPSSTTSDDGVVTAARSE